MTMTLNQARQAGWTLEVEDNVEDASAVRADGLTVAVTSNDPQVALLAIIDQIENPPAPPDPIDLARASKLVEIQQTLADTDKWITRAYEEGIPLPDARKGYREQLRGLLIETKTSSDPAAIDIPTAPDWVPTAS